MRTIKNQNIPQETDYTKFPDSTIKNETETNEGTPVIREIYGDLLTNFYAFLRDRKVIPNQLEDNELNGYQIVNAIRKSVNELNDIEQILSKSGTIWSVLLDLSIVPDKYVFFARASENYTNGTSYTFKGTDNLVYNFTSSGFQSGDELMIVIDQSEVRAYSIGNAQEQNELVTVFGTPLAFNDNSAKIWYQEDGKLFSDLPEIYDLQTTLRNQTFEPTLLIYEMICFQNNIVCLTKIPGQNFNFYTFSVNDFSTGILLTTGGFDFTGSGDVFMYCTGNEVILTNYATQSNNDFKMLLAYIDFSNNTINYQGDFQVDSSFVKTTNAVATKSGITTFVNGDLKHFPANASPVIDLGVYNSFVGNIFKLKSNVYYSNGEVAKKWNIQ